MTSKKLGHSYSHKRGHSESLFIRSVNVVEKREFLRRNLEKIQTGNQFVISKLGSGASSSFVGFRALAFDEISSEEGV